MYDYIEGDVTELNPSYVILDNQGIGYFIHVSLNTYTAISQNQELSTSKRCKIYVYQIVREDALMLYGFSDTKEREVFKHLVSVSGVGANTGRMILSSLSPQHLTQAVVDGDVNQLKKIKGIGAKSAQRIIVELKDKLKQSSGEESGEFMPAPNNTTKNEAFSALVTLGFSKGGAEKVIDQILTHQKDVSVEDLVKEALKRL